VTSLPKVLYKVVGSLILVEISFEGVETGTAKMGRGGRKPLQQQQKQKRSFSAREMAALVSLGVLSIVAVGAASYLEALDDTILHKINWAGPLPDEMLVSYLWSNLREYVEEMGNI